MTRKYAARNGLAAGVLLALGAAIGTGRAAAQQADPCGHAGSTRAANECYDREVEKARGEARALLARLQAQNPSADTARLTELRTEQQSWSKYEQDHCSFVADYFRGGTMVNTRYAGCELALERERVRELRTELQLECSFQGACRGGRDAEEGRRH